MKTTKISHIVFSLAVIAALMLAAVPMAPAHALTSTASAQATTLTAPDNSPANAVVCRSFTVWRHGHRVTIRICHRVPHDKK